MLQRIPTQLQIHRNNSYSNLLYINFLSVPKICCFTLFVQRLWLCVRQHRKAVDDAQRELRCDSWLIQTITRPHTVHCTSHRLQCALLKGWELTDIRIQIYCNRIKTINYSFPGCYSYTFLCCFRSPSSKICSACSGRKSGQQFPAAITVRQHPCSAAQAPANTTGQTGGQSLLPQVQVSL